MSSLWVGSFGHLVRTWSTVIGSVLQVAHVTLINSSATLVPLAGDYLIPWLLLWVALLLLRSQMDSPASVMNIAVWWTCSRLPNSCSWTLVPFGQTCQISSLRVESFGYLVWTWSTVIGPCGLKQPGRSWHLDQVVRIAWFHYNTPI
jgi:hypothetical protein